MTPLESRKYDPKARPAFDEWVEVVPEKVAPAPSGAKAERSKLVLLALAVVVAGILAIGATVLHLFGPKPPVPSKPTPKVGTRGSGFSITQPTLVRTSPNNPEKARRLTFTYNIEQPPANLLASSKVDLKDRATCENCTIRNVSVKADPPSVTVELTRDSDRPGGSLLINQLPSSNGEWLTVTMGKKEDWAEIPQVRLVTASGKTGGNTTVGKAGGGKKGGAKTGGGKKGGAKEKGAKKHNPKATGKKTDLNGNKDGKKGAVKKTGHGENSGLGRKKKKGA